MSIKLLMPFLLSASNLITSSESVTDDLNFLIISSLESSNISFHLSHHYF